ncbi:hypothetical protein ABIE38_000320 [Dietzia sp. 2505]
MPPVASLDDCRAPDVDDVLDRGTAEARRHDEADGAQEASLR